MIKSAETMWDKWFDSQYDLIACIDKAVNEEAKDKPELFKASLYSGIIEHCAEQMRSSIELGGINNEANL